MKEKSTLTKFIELAMNCQVKNTNEALKKTKKLPPSLARKKTIDEIHEYHNDFMSDCQAILDAEKLYLKMQSN